MSAPSAVRLLVGPALLAVAAVVWYVSDRLLHVGPFDRAQVGWGVVVPLIIAAPIGAALAAGAGEGRRYAWLVATVSIGLAGLTVAWLALTIRMVLCAPVSSPLEAVSHVIPLGLATGALFALPAWTARAGREARGVAGAVGGGIAGFLAAAVAWFLALAATFPGVSCVPAS